MIEDREWSKDREGEGAEKLEEEHLLIILTSKGEERRLFKNYAEFNLFRCLVN